MQLELDLPRRPSAPRIARERLGNELRGAIGDRALADVKLVVTELVTNAVVHGDGPIRLRARTGGSGIRIEVEDDGTRSAPVMAAAPPARSGGLGLRIVDALATTWGVTAGHSLVWADMRGS